MGCVRRGDNHQIDIRMLDGLFRRCDDGDFWQVTFHFLFITRGDNRQIQAVDGLDQRGVKSFADEAVANQGNINVLTVSHKHLRVLKHQR